MESFILIKTNINMNKSNMCIAVIIIAALSILGYNFAESNTIKDSIVIIETVSIDTLPEGTIPLDSIQLLNDTTGVYKQDTFLIKDYSLVEPTDSI